MKIESINFWIVLLFLSHLRSFVWFFFAKINKFRNSVLERRTLVFQKRRNICFPSGEAIMVLVYNVHGYEVAMSPLAITKQAH